MKFSVIRIMTNVIVVFMILGYLVIGHVQANISCGTSDNPLTATTSQNYNPVCVTASPSDKAKEVENAKTDFFNFNRIALRKEVLSNCTAACTKSSTCFQGQVCKPSDPKKLNGTNLILVKT